MAELGPEDLRRSVAAAAQALEASAGADWSVAAGDLEWSCRRTLDHAIDANVWYAANLATHVTEDVDVLRDGSPESAPITDVLQALVISGHILARVAEATPAGGRGYHGAGMADATGFVAMGCDETLVHAYDIGRGLGVPFLAPADVCDRLVRRLFPWAPEHADPWERLLWSNGRISLPGHERLGPKWGWWCRPLDEWDGVPRLDRGLDV
jgi:uncharacterized protein (TIGR03083 family)